MKIQFESGTVNYLDQGAGPAVLLIHAFPLNHTMWQPQLATLTSRFRVIAPDVRGFGESGPPSPWTMDEMANNMAEFLDRLRISESAVVGLSMGGYISLPYYSQYPQRVRQLVLADTRARADTETEKAARTDMIAALEQGGIAILPGRMIPRLLQPDPSPDVVRLVREMIETTGVSAAIHAVAAMRDRADSSTLLRRLQCPALVIAGQNDLITNIQESRAMAESIPGGRFVGISKAGHLSNLENPEEFNRALAEFLL